MVSVFSGLSTENRHSTTENFSLKCSVEFAISFVPYFSIKIFRHNNTIENVLLDGNGLTHDLIEAIRLICDRNSTNHQLQEKTKMQTSFLLQELENTKTLALDQSARFENEIDISRQEKIQLEANLWANKSKTISILDG